VSEGPIKAASLSGDTAEVWKGNRALMLLNDRPYHLYQFAQKADTAYRAGDSFMLSMNTTWLMQQGNRQATVYLAITYANDSTVKQYSTVSSSGNTTLRIPYCKERVKEIKGFVMCGMRPSTDDTNSLCVLFVNNIQLFRFHNKIIEQPVMPQPQRDSILEMKPDTAQYESQRGPGQHVAGRPLTIGDIQKMRKNEPKK
jgi:hypothetical protein